MSMFVFQRNYRLWITGVFPL